MADKGKSHISVRLTEAVGIINEAGRTIEAYTYDAKREPKALLDIEKDRENNRTFILKEELLHKNTKGRTINGIRKIFREKTGKNPSDDATIRATILTMPIKEIKGLNFDITVQEAVALEKHNNGEALDAGDEKALESAKKKLIHLNYTPKQMQQIYDWTEAAIKAICKVNGIKRDDILYAVLHCNGESSPHLHLGFMPCVYLSNQVNEQGEIIGGSKRAYDDYHLDVAKRNENIESAIADGATPAEARAMYPVIKRPKTFDGDTNREIADDEPAYGSSANRYNKYFLKYYLDNIQKEMRALGVETTLRNGHGHTFDVDKKSHAERTEEKFEARIIEMKQIYEAQIEEAKAAEAKAIAARDTAQSEARAMKEEFDETYLKMRSELKAVIDEKTAARSDALAAKEEAVAAQADAIAAKEELEAVNRELSEANASIEIANATIAELEEQKEVVNSAHRESRSKFRDFFGNFKSIFTKIVNKALDIFFNKHLDRIINAETPSERRRLIEEARKEMLGNMYEPMQELEADASPVLVTQLAGRAPEEYSWLDLPARPSESATPEENAEYTKKLNQKRNFAIGRVFLAFEEDSSKAEPQYAHLRNYFAVSAGAEKACASPAMELIIEDFYNREKYAPIAETITDEEEYEAYKNGLNRACRSLEYLDDYLKSEQLDLESFERE